MSASLVPVRLMPAGTGYACKLQPCRPSRAGKWAVLSPPLINLLGSWLRSSGPSNEQRPGWQAG